MEATALGAGSDCGAARGNCLTGVGIEVGYDQILCAADRLCGVAHRTPAVTSRTVDARTGARVYFKCELLQRAGAFKFRGAYNALSRFTAEQRQRGVLTYSSGNHAQAMSLAGQILGIPVTIVMPADAPSVKLAAVREYGGQIVTYDRATQNRESVGALLAAERGLEVVPPYDHPDVIAGQGTAAKELLEDVGGLDLLLVPCGGGGLLAGSALSANAIDAHCRVIGVEPAAADDAARSFRSGVLQTVSNPDTIADGARTPSLGNLTFPLIQRLVYDMVTVEDDALLRWMGFIWERMKLLVEPTGALAAAAVLEKVVDVRGARVGLILSGGNVDVTALAASRGRIAGL